jgi:predicted dehydrogenase
MQETLPISQEKTKFSKNVENLNVAIVGCGLIGQKRAKTINKYPSLSVSEDALSNTLLTLHTCIDQIKDRAENLSKQFPGAVTSTHWQDAINNPNIHIIMISTLHASLAEIALAAAREGKHLLIEKPAAKHSDELLPIIETAKKTGTLARVGFNHRHHRAFRKARKLIDDGELGELMFIRARYGHGGRVGYEKEWRANPALSGGGELIDQGVHLIDLARWFLGDFINIQGLADTFFWDMPVDDNSFLLLKTEDKKIAFLHASCTEWKNTFSFEIYGKNGKIDINGLGGSYGVERISFYKMSAAMGPPETFIWEYPMADDSWDFELNEFVQDITLNRQPNPGLYEAYQTLKIVEEIYRISK